MARSFEVQRGRISPRKLKVLALIVVVSAVSFNILRPKEQELQRALSPDGSQVGVLTKFTYVQPHLRVKTGSVHSRLEVAYTSPAITNRFEELQPRLVWTGSPSRLVLLLQEEAVWAGRSNPSD